MRRSPCPEPRRRWACRRAVQLAVRLAGLAVGWLAAGPTLAHDTWLAWRDGGVAGEQLLALGTGDAYPRMGSPVPWRGVAEAACRAPGGAVVALAPRRQAPDALWLAATGLPSQDGLVCWARTRSQVIALAPAEVATYLAEVRAGPEVHAAWAAQRADGRPWQELFSKHARLERYGPGGHGQGHDRVPADGRAAVGMPLELAVSGDAPVVGAQLTLQAWRDGRPAAGLALQLLNDRAPAGLWLRTDAQGQARLRLPLAGPWLVRATELTPPAQPDGPWVSRFATLAFEPLAD